ncbi:MAG TPA: GxxExxY protein, partial [Candidatus Absconditabacterales bacterium]|nr:GxxExxY protein [Candidatus Absconditabacterales bacterium]
GQIGYIVTGLKSVRDAQIGDTIINDYQKVKKFAEDFEKQKNATIPQISSTIPQSSEILKSSDVNALTYDIIGTCMKIHRELGGGMRENVYKNAIIKSLQKKGHTVKDEVPIKISFEGENVGKGFIDLVIDDKVVVELKSIGFIDKNCFKQIRTYLNNVNINDGLVIDFGGKSLLYRRFQKNYEKPASQSSLISKSSENFHNLLQSLSIPGFKKSKPFVYAGVYPIETPDYDKLKDSLEKLSLNDSSIEYSMEDSKALGLGFRCGFLGMLHMDIIKERLSREFDLETIFTTPTVVYLVKSKTPALDKIKSGANVTELAKTGYYRPILLINGISQEEVDQTKDFSIGEIIEKYGSILKLRMIVKAGSDIKEQGIIDEIYEPIGEVEIVGPQEYTGEIMSLCQSYRGEMQNMEHIDQTRVVRKYLLPMGEIIVDFYDRLKSATKGYATMNYEFKRYQKSDLVKLDIYLNGEKIEALSMIIHKDNSAYQGRDIVKKLKELIPRHMFVIPIQAGIGNKMIARENISALKKDVIAKCYGGDISRKRKLLQKQKEGKKKMKAMGSVNVPSDVFIKMVTK